jgi:hypothetical protein
MSSNFHPSIHPSISLSLSVSPRNGRLLPFLGSTSLYFFALQFFIIFIVFHLHILYDFMFFCVLNLNSCISLFTGENLKLKCEVPKSKFHQKFNYHHNQILNGIWVVCLHWSWWLLAFLHSKERLCNVHPCKIWDIIFTWTKNQFVCVGDSWRFSSCNF